MRESTLANTVTVLAIGTIVAVAFWLTGASLDVFTNADGSNTRVAMFRSPTELLWLVPFFISLAWLSTSKLNWIKNWLGAYLSINNSSPIHTSQFILPLGALSLLIVPYLPWLPELFPVLQVLAGPLRFVIWFVVLAQVVYLLRKTVLRPQLLPPQIVSGSSQSLTAIVLVASFVVVMGTGFLRINPGGDEPHYLIISQSLWLDGDLAIENNHDRRDYSDYFSGLLKPHYLSRGIDGEIYSVHPIGLPVLIAPIYAFGGFHAVILLLTAFGAVAATLMWRLARKVCGSNNAAFFSWAAICLSTPYLCNASTIYPEIVAALCVMLAFATHEFSSGPTGLIRTTIIPTLAICALPWLSTKYAPMAGMLAVVITWRLWDIKPHLIDSDTRLLRLVISLGLLTVCFVGWLFFFYSFWGSPLPSAPYGTDTMTKIGYSIVGAPALLLDQEYGVFLYAPVLIIGLTGLVSMLRNGGPPRRLAIEIALVVTALLITVGSHRMWWGGSVAPGRPLTSGLLLLGVPIAWQYRNISSALQRHWYQLLLLVSMGVTGIITTQGRQLIRNSRDGSSTLLEWLSPNWNLWSLFPSFIHHDSLTALGFASVWFAVAGTTLWIANYLVRKMTDVEYLGQVTKRWGQGLSALSATATSAFIILIVSVLIPLLFGDRLQASMPLEARSSIELLDKFDATTRPMAVVYNPATWIKASEVPPYFKFLADQSITREPQPIPLLYNARFSLPAGTYSVKLSWKHQESSENETIPKVASLGWRLTRAGPPMGEWLVPIENTNPWRQILTLLFDSNFVGFSASTELEALSPNLQLRPINIQDHHARTTTRIVSAVHYRDVDIFSHTKTVWMEKTGFWVRGSATSTVTLSKPTETEQNIVLRYHCGPQSNEVTLSTVDWHSTELVTPGEWKKSSLPSTPNGLVKLHISTLNGFVPNKVKPSSGDLRFLGCWFEVDRNKQTG